MAGQEGTGAFSVGSDHPYACRTPPAWPRGTGQTGKAGTWNGSRGMVAKEWLGRAGAEGRGQDGRGKGIAALPGHAGRANNRERGRNGTRELKGGSPGAKGKGHGKKRAFSLLLAMPPPAQPWLAASPTPPLPPALLRGEFRSLLSTFISADGRV